MSRTHTPFVTFCIVMLLALVGCANQPAPTTVSSPVSEDLPTPTLTPAVLLPGTPSRALPTPFGTLATGVSLLPAPSAQPSVAVPASAAVPILMYHQIKELPLSASLDDLTWTVSPAALNAQLGYLAEKGYVTIGLDQLLDGFVGKASLPPKAVVITFDDGWKTQYTAALPLLKQRNQTATFYVVSSYMGYGAYFDWAMTEEIRNAGMTIAGHSIDHANLPTKSAAELDRELRESKAALEKKLNVTVAHFAYPYGAYNDAVVEAVKRAGYRSATTLIPTAVKNPVAPYLLPRIRVSYKETLADFAKKLP